MYKLLKKGKILRHLQNEQCWSEFSESIDFLLKNHKEISPREIKSLSKSIKFGKKINERNIEIVYLKLCRELQSLDGKELKRRRKLVQSFESLIKLENKLHEINSMHFFDLYIKDYEKHRKNIKGSLKKITLHTRENKVHAKKNEKSFDKALLFLEKEANISIKEINYILLTLENLQWENNKSKTLESDIKVTASFFKRIIKNLLEDEKSVN